MYIIPKVNMPTLISQQEVKIEWTDINKLEFRPRPKRIRSNGIHLSGIIKYVLETSGLLSADDVTDEMPLRMCVGMAWEDWAVSLWPEMTWQPGESVLDGVVGSPDGWSATGNPSPTVEGAGVLEEFKATWKSAFTRPDITKEKIWMWQLAGYCKMLEIHDARLHVLWINGTYRPPAPVYATYVLKFNQAELDRFWSNVVLKNKEKAKPEIHES